MKKNKKYNARKSNNQQISKTSNRVFSYYSSRNNVELRTERKTQKEGSGSTRIHKMNKFIVLISFIVIMGCLFYVSTLEPNGKVITLSSFQPQKSLLREAKVYQQGLDIILRSSIFNRSKLTINTVSIENEMKKQFPELQDVALTIPIMGHKPVVQINTSSPTLIISNSKGSFVVDRRGKAIIRTEEVKNLSLLNLPIVIDQSGIDVEAGTSVLTVSDAEFIDQLVTQLKGRNINIQSITLPPLANEMHVKIEGQPYTLKFNLLNESLQQIGAFLSVKQKLETEGKVPSQYIDLRVEEKVYYK